MTRGDDGDETRYVFFRLCNEENKFKEVGYVLLRDEFEYEGSNLREEYFSEV